jgi:predicted RNase H-like nuclease (RuvC/YqgF family)
LQLFDFELEVQPVFEVLVGKTVEQALTEVLEEEELEALRVQQRRFRELRASEKAEQQRIEEQDERLREEKVTNAAQPPTFRFSSMRSRFHM